VRKDGGTKLRPIKMPPFASITRRSYGYYLIAIIVLISLFTQTEAGFTVVQLTKQDIRQEKKRRISKLNRDTLSEG